MTASWQTDKNMKYWIIMPFLWSAEFKGSVYSVRRMREFRGLLNHYDMIFQNSSLN